MHCTGIIYQKEVRSHTKVPWMRGCRSLESNMHNFFDVGIDSKVINKLRDLVQVSLIND